MIKIKKDQILTIIISTVLFVLGLLFCVLPQNMYEFLETIVCFCLIGYGLLCMVIYCFNPNIFSDVKILLSSVFSFIIGVLMVVINSFFTILLSIAIGLYGIIVVIIALKYYKKNNNPYIIRLLIGFLIFIFASLVIIFSYVVYKQQTAIIFYGISFIFISLFNFLNKQDFFKF